MTVMSPKQNSMQSGTAFRFLCFLALTSFLHLKYLIAISFLKNKEGHKV